MSFDRLILDNAHRQQHTAPDETGHAVLDVLAGTSLDEAARRIRIEPSDLAAAVELYQQAGCQALREQGAAKDWWQIYVHFADWDTAEDVAVRHLTPVLNETATEWWFIRKHPCWRLRLRAVDGVKDSVTEALDGIVAAGHLHRWWPGIYEPENIAFGNAIGMKIAHELFHADSRAILEVRLGGESPLGRRELSVLLCTILMRAAGVEWYEQGDVWRRVAEDRPLPADIPPARVEALADDLRKLLRADTSPDGMLLSPDGPLSFAAEWVEGFRRAGRALGTATRSGALDRGLRHVLAYHVIFHWNRLGLPYRQQCVLAWTAQKVILET
ncbi:MULTISPECIES: thiopeptide-type bacteriocin biosynthesis protein [Streptomyces]|uniref:thiopeptide-type bacteriocin biosynthesis protein n=1 Tax=Streptomyces TaxID=1883 RepID=UPI00345BEE05